MSSTPQDTRAQRNAAHARNSSSTGHVVNVRYWPKADKLIIPPNVGFGDKEDITVDGQNVRL
ncbi:MAG: hypothetical protein WBE05_01165 [Pseudolabrys sp.]|jgi:hypothetical protein